MFRRFVLEKYAFDVAELREKWRQIKYGDVREREKFVDMLVDAVEDFKVSIKEKVAPTTLQSRLSTIQSYIRKGCGIKDFEVRLLKRIYLTYHNRDVVKEELRKILEHAPLRERLFFLMMAESGLRPRTLVQLRYKHIKADFEAGKIPMKIDVPAMILKDRIGDRFTFIGEDGFRLLKEYLSLRKQLEDESLIFEPEVKSRAKHEYLSPETFSNAFSDIVLKLGLDKPKNGKPKSLRLYCLRKYFLNNMTCDSLYKLYWFGHRQTSDYYLSKDVEKHREEYAKGYPNLRVFQPTHIEKALAEQQAEIEKLRNELTEMRAQYQQALETIEILRKSDIVQLLLKFYQEHPELLKGLEPNQP
jgi:integrase